MFELLAAPRPLHPAATSDSSLAQRSGSARNQSPLDIRQAYAELLDRAAAFADELAARPNLGPGVPPVVELERCSRLGLLTAGLPIAFGGLGLGSDAGTHLTLLRLLSIVGGADLGLARVLEGHYNGLLLVTRYGSAEQVAALAQDTHAGHVSGVWNTGPAHPLRLEPEADDTFRLNGGKTFATGAAFVGRPIVTAEFPGRGWQMVLVPMDRIKPAIDQNSWNPLGMEGSESFAVDFTGAVVDWRDLIGNPGDFYQDPLFRGGAIRFAAVHAGAILRLHAHFADWLDHGGRGENPFQIARLADIAIAAQTGVLWIERAAAVAEQSLYRSEKVHRERMVETADMMRLAVERLATDVMDKITTGVGAHGLLQPAPFERLIRDLTMYLRQPAPDATRTAVGRLALEKTHRRSQGTADGFWTGDRGDESLPTRYFDRIYRRNRDPWSFETSEYERQKYQVTLEALPYQRYTTALEVGCSIGVLTRLLADRADHLLSLDLSERALAIARQRCEELPHVHFLRARLPDDLGKLSSDGFNLIVVSEVAYYWSPEDLDRTAAGLAERQGAGGHLLLVHFTEPVPDYPLTGDQVHNLWLARPEWKHLTGERHQRFRLDLLERRA